MEKDISRERVAFVRELQTYLRQIADDNPRIPIVGIDGLFGKETTKAVAAFQREYGLSETGRVNRETWDALFSSYELIMKKQAPPEPVSVFPTANTILHLGDRGDAVEVLQIMLRTLCLKFSNLSAIKKNGIYDDDTHRVITEIQKRSALSPTGLTDKDTWDLIANAYATHRLPSS